VTHRVDVLDPAAVGLSWLGSYGLVWLALALVVAVLQRRPAVFLATALATLGADALATGLKHAIGRERPYVEHPLPEPLMTTHFDLSLPSGHAATSFAGATVLALLVPRLAPAVYALAVLVSLSRVYVGVHFPLDIVAGAALGAAVGWAVARLARRRSPVRRPAGAA
jgi:membrane-associated phospholipid phosphatase